MIVRRQGLRPPAAVVCGALLLAAALPAAADWLVTRDGARIETEGPWEVKGRQVIFTKKHGSLSAIRLSDVDLEASRAATDAPEGAAGTVNAGAEVEREPVLVLTNKDIRRVAVDPAGAVDEGSAGAAGAAERTPAAPQTEAPVELVSWKANPSRQIDGLELVGAVRNNGTDVAAKVTVEVTIPDGEGGTLYETKAFLRSTGLPPGGTTTFRALLPGIFQLVEDPVFRVTAGGITLLGRTGVPEAGDPAAGDPAAEAEGQDGEP